MLHDDINSGDRAAAEVEKPCLHPHQQPLFALNMARIPVSAR